MVELLGPVNRVASLIPVSWSSAKWFEIETLSTLVKLILSGTLFEWSFILLHFLIVHYFNALNERAFEKSTKFSAIFSH